MRRYTPLVIVASLWLALLVSLPGAAAAQTADDVRVTQVDTSNYPEVTLYVAVKDQNGETRSGLRQNDFSVTEDGTPVSIEGFAGGGAQVNTALVIDHSGSMHHADKLEGAQDAARVFVEQMRPVDRTMLIGFASDARTLQQLTDDKDELEQAIDRLDADGGTALYDSIIEGVDAFRDVGGRRVLLVLTDGQDTSSYARLSETIAHANRYEQPLYVVGLGDKQISNGNSESGIDESVLQHLASETYGEYFYAPDGEELAALYARLSEDLQDEYMLTYTSPRPSYDGTRRDIQVSVGAVSSAGAYTERHLINVNSNPFVGVLLLLPLLFLLGVPSLLKGRGWRMGQHGGIGAAPPASSLPIADRQEEAQPAFPSHSAHTLPAAPAAPDNQPAHTPASPPVNPASVRYCDQCGKPLRTDARFCGSCGASVISPGEKP